LDKLNRGPLLKALVNLGFSETDAEVYVFLILDGPQKGKNIAVALNLYKQQLYRSLNRLRSKGVVTVTLEHPAYFSAIPLERVLDLLIEVRKEQASALKAERKELLSSWRSMIEKDSSNS